MPNDFDTHAHNYDDIFTYSPIGKAQRKRVHFFLSKLLDHTPLSILEINCGTGEDARYLTDKGHHVLATDISEKMIEEAKKKYSTIQFEQFDITQLTKDSFQKKFDVIFSNFGGLNCLSKEALQDFLNVSEQLLHPNGKLIAVLMPKLTLWERVYFFGKGKLKKAFRRNTNQKVMTNVEGVLVPTWYYNPKEIVTLAKKSLVPIAIKPIGWSIPPSYLNPFFFKKKTWLRGLAKVESKSESSFLAKYADHYLIAFQKQ